MFFGCNMSSEPLKESLANELLQKLKAKELEGYIADEKADPLEIYKKEVKAYQKWLEEVTEGFTEDQRKNLVDWLNTRNYAKACMWSYKLEGMTTILGLTKEEEDKINANCYIDM